MHVGPIFVELSPNLARFCSLLLILLLPGNRRHFLIDSRPDAVAGARNPFSTVDAHTGGAHHGASGDVVHSTGEPPQVATFRLGLCKQTDHINDETGQRKYWEKKERSLIFETLVSTRSSKNENPP